MAIVKPFRGLRPPRELVEQFKIKCKETDTSQASVLRDAIADFLKED